MQDLSVVAASGAAVVIVVALCATARPAASASLAKALYALAALAAAVVPWSRAQPHAHADEDEPATPGGAGGQLR